MQLRSRSAQPRGVFVTVGTTSFDALARAVDDPALVTALEAAGYTSLTLQLGRGAYTPTRTVAEGRDEATTAGGFTVRRVRRACSLNGRPPPRPTLTRLSLSLSLSSLSSPRSWFRFAPALDSLVAAAALVVSHAGAGSIFEALRARKPLLVVVNTALMDNHQTELAEALAAEGCVRRGRGVWSQQPHCSHLLALAPLRLRSPFCAGISGTALRTG